MLNEVNQIHNFIFSSGSGTVINHGSGSDFLTSYGSGSARQKVTVPTVPVPVPQHCPLLPMSCSFSSFFIFSSVYFILFFLAPPQVM
jgi:hypothetical protein